jgi:hypothetical protein
LHCKSFQIFALNFLKGILYSLSFTISTCDCTCRNIHAATALVQAQLDASTSALQDASQPHLNSLEDTSNTSKLRTTCNSDIVQLINSSESLNCKSVQEVLCAIVAEQLDTRSLGVLHSTFGHIGSERCGATLAPHSTLNCLSPASTIAILARVKDLNRAIQVGLIPSTYLELGIAGDITSQTSSIASSCQARHSILD